MPRSWSGLLATLLLALPTAAQERTRNLQVSGFGTLGLAGTDTHKVGFHRDNGQAPAAAAIDHPTGDVDTRLGLQLSSQLSDTVLATIQVMSSNRYDNTYKPEISYACLAWSPLPDFLARAGYMELEVLPNGDTTNIGYGLPWVRPPVEVFGPLGSNRVKGIDLAQGLALGPGASLELGLFGGISDFKRPVTGVGSWDWSGGRTFGVSTKLQTAHLRVRGAYTWFTVPSNIPGSFAAFQDGLRNLGGLLGDPRPAQAAAALDAKDVHFKNLQFGALWEAGPWQLQGEFAQQDTRSVLFPRSNSGFLSAGYRIGPVTPFLMCARAVSERPAAPDLGNLGSLAPSSYGPLAAAGQAAVLAVDAIVAARCTDQYTWSAGLRWDFADQADLKLQVDRIRSHNATGLLQDFNPLVPSGWDGRMTVLSVTLDFVFGRGLR